VRALGCWAALGLLLLAGAASAADDKASGAYAFHAPLQVVAGAPLQRVPLPAAALVRLQQPDYADVRVFNAQGQALAMALLAPSAAPAERRKTDLKPMPVLGAPGSLTVTGGSLQVDPAGRARVVGLSGAPDPASTVVLGVLLDVRSVRDAARELVLKVDMPEQQPVTFRLEASADLSQWQAVSEQVVYRGPGDLSAVTLAIDRPELVGRYLRVTWQSSTKLLAPVRVRGATLTTERSAAVQMERAEISGAKLATPHELEFGLAFATPIAALQLAPAGQSTVIPVRILGRADREQPWTLLATGTASRLERGGAVETGAAIRLTDQRFRFIRVEADKRTSGFPTPPGIEVQFAPREIAVLVSGDGPYTLAAGLKGASAAYLPLESLMTAAAADTKVSDLPMAPAARSTPVVMSLSDGGGGLLATSILLWAALLGGTAVLGFIAWLASKRPAAPPEAEPARKTP
jgi:Protein of unknown function (DUF3999)